MTPSDVRRYMSFDLSPVHGDDDGRAVVLAGDRPFTKAAVLILIIEQPTGATILFTQRAADLRNHAGQISFPGGKIDLGDADDIAAALREAQEEIALHPTAVEVIGRLGHYQTHTGFSISPIIGLVAAPQLFVPQASEVASVFEVPLNFLVDPANIEIRSRMFENRQRRYYAISYQEHIIWGATAAILVQFLRTLGVHIDALA
jgi:8-oxo-dGTP pyrophosphatase MutT (NUDIX family)